MINLTDQQRKSVEDGEVVQVRDNGQEFVLLRADVYEKLSKGAYDNGPWTAEETDAVREESVTLLDRFGTKP